MKDDKENDIEMNDGDSTESPADGNNMHANPESEKKPHNRKVIAAICGLALVALTAAVPIMASATKPMQIPRPNPCRRMIPRKAVPTRLRRTALRAKRSLTPTTGLSPTRPSTMTL